MKSFRPFLIVVLTLALLVPMAEAGDEPTIVVEFSSIKQLVKDVYKIEKAVEVPGMTRELPAALIDPLPPEQLKLIDMDGPFRYYVFLPGQAALDAGDKDGAMPDLEPRVVTFTSLTGSGDDYVAALTETLGGAAVEEDGIHIFTREVYGLEHAFYVMPVEKGVLSGTDIEAISSVVTILADKTDFFSSEGTIRIFVDVDGAVPFTEAAVNMAVAQMANIPADVEMPYDVGRILKIEGEILVKLMREFESCDVSISVGDKAVEAQTKIIPAKDSATAGLLADLEVPSDTYMTLFPDNSTLAMAGSGFDAYDEAADEYAEFVSEVYGAMGGEFAKTAPELSQAMLDMKGTIGGDVAMCVVPGENGVGVEFLEVIALKDPEKMKKISDDMIDLYTGQASGYMPGVTMKRLKTRKYNEIEIEAFSYDLNMDDVADEMQAAMMPSWMDGMTWEMAFVGDDMLYTMGRRQLMNKAIDSLAKGGTSIDKSDRFRKLFPEYEGGAVGVYTASLSGLLKDFLGGIDGISPELLALIPDETGGIAGYSMVNEKKELVCLERYSLDEIGALSKAMPALMSFGTQMSGMDQGFEAEGGPAPE